MSKVCKNCGASFTRSYSRSVLSKIKFCSNTCAALARTRSASERFDEKVTAEPNTGCHLWMGGYLKSGYGSFSSSGKEGGRAHVFAYERAYGPLKNGVYVCHRCDVPGCVNPAHLFAGTQRQNMDDARRKGRVAHGVTQGHSKLTDDDVRAIRAWTGKLSDAAKQFGIAASSVTHIRQRKNWKHVQ